MLTPVEANRDDIDLRLNPRLRSFLPSSLELLGEL